MSLFQKMNEAYLHVLQKPTGPTLGISKLAAPEAHIEITVTARH